MDKKNIFWGFFFTIILVFMVVVVVRVYNKTQTTSEIKNENVVMIER